MSELQGMGDPGVMILHRRTADELRAAGYTLTIDRTEGWGYWIDQRGYRWPTDMRGGALVPR